MINVMESSVKKTVKVAVMQPYLFPYIGYFQLIGLVDYFVIFDDVNYIKNGWINKNRILQQGHITPITLPVQKASQNRKINQHCRTTDLKQLDKLKKQIKQSYAKAPFFDDVYPLICNIIDNPEVNLAKYVTHSLVEISSYMGLKTKFIYASQLSNHDDWDDAQRRIIDITQQLSGTEYYNLPGGKALYDDNVFSNSGIALHFINPQLIQYQQQSKSFSSGLSIIDFLMCSAHSIQSTPGE